MNFGAIVDWIQSYVTKEIVAAMVAAVFAGVLFESWRMLRALCSRVGAFLGARRRLRALDRRITEVRRSGRWSGPVLGAASRVQRKLRSSIPIILFANHKGGVGKTTLAANLGAYFAIRQNAKVLYVDLDFQGTLSSTLSTMKRLTGDENARVKEIFRSDDIRGEIQTLFDRRIPLDGIRAAARSSEHAGDFDRSAFYGADDEFAELEDWLFLKWMGERSRQDIRFLLADFLTQNPVQDAFDVVILDAPPRNTVGGINGLCACTHIVIPTKADRFSTNGAWRFIETASVLRRTLAPHARMLGYVTTMVQGANRARSEAEQELESRIEEEPLRERGGAAMSVASFWPKGSRFDHIGDLLNRQSFASDAASTISYLQDAEVRGIIDKIGDEIAERINQAETV